MKIALGIDFGTTNSTVCFFDGTDFHYSDLEDKKQTIPSLMYVNKQYYPTYGELARSQFLHDNLNRRIKLEKTTLGFIEIALGDNAYETFDHTGFDPAPTTYNAQVSAFTDRNLPGFLFASTKRLLGQSGIDSVRLFEKDIKLEAVVSSMIRNIHEKATQKYSNVTSSNICVGRPVNYECVTPHKQHECNALAIKRMDKALEYAGIREYTYFLEPIAPVLSHIHQTDDEQKQNILVLDFGGGTLDFSILKKRKKLLEVVGSFGLPLGGDVITDKLIKDFVFPEIGLNRKNLARLKDNNNYIEDMIPDILNWRTTYILNQPKYFIQIAEAIKLLPEEAERLNRIRLLIIQNFSYNVFYAVDTAKKRLSSAANAEIELAQIGISLTITKSNIEKSMQNYLSSVESSINSFLSNNGYETAQIGRVLLTGGTSLIPCIKHRIECLFPDKVTTIDPFLSIVNGFALGAWLQGQKKISHDHNQIQIDAI